MTEREQIEQAIALLESQRAVLGEHAVEMALAPLRNRLAALDQTISPRLRAERKFVTVMFADVAGFTALSETLDPEAVRDLMNDCFEQLVPVIEKYEGTVDKFIGDGVMVLFGAPLTHENDPERALRAALDMMTVLANFNAARGVDLGLHFGINTGMVVAGGLGTAERQEYSVMGDVVNVASRLEEVSQRGEIIVGPDTYRLTAPLFEFDALEPIRLKGKAEPVPLYRLRACKVVAGKVRGIVGLVSPLVGREAEFEALQQAIAAVQAGRGGIVTLIGEAGLGKSRLMTEVHQAVRGPLTWVEGRSISYGGSIAYLPWLDVLRGILNVSLDAPLETVRAALQTRLKTLCPDCADRLYPYLGRMLSLPLEQEAAAKLEGLDGKTLQSATFQAVETLIVRLTGEGPVVIVGEDMHWVDPTSLALWKHLMALTESVPLLLISVMRPEQEHGCWQIYNLAAQRYAARHTALWLEPLSAAESEKLVGNLLRVEHLPPELHGKILKHAEGNPFYVEEIIRSLMDVQAIAYDEATGLWQATRQVAEIELPETLQGVLAGRIDRLQAETKRILQLAAVIGRSFLYRVLAEIAREEQALDSHLLSLVQQQMIRERRRLPELEYIFKHQLTQEAAYNSLLKKERREFHRQVGEALERLFPDRADELVGLLAYHWERAGDDAKALAYLTRAGQLTAAQFANAEAVNYYNRALSLLPPDRQQERYNLLLACNLAYDFLGDRANQARVLQAAGELAEAAGNGAWRGQIAHRWADYYWATGDFAAAREYAQKAINLGQAAQDVKSQAWGYFVWGRVLMYEEQYNEARERLEQSLPLAREIGDRFLEGQVLRNIGNVLCFQNNYASSQPYIEQALAIHREQGDRASEAAALNTLGLICRGLNDATGDLEYMEQALATYREIGHRFGQGMVLLNMGEYYRNQNQYDRARECFEQGMTIWKQAGNRQGEGSMLSHLGTLCFMQGHYAAAQAYFEQALAVMQEINHRPGYVEAIESLGWIAAAHGHYAQARRAFEQALAWQQEAGEVLGIGEALGNLAFVSYRLGEYAAAERVFAELLQQCQQADDAVLRNFEINIRRTLAAVAYRQGDYEMSQAYSRQALEIARQRNNRREEAETLTYLGHALAELGDLTGAASAYQDALALLRELPPPCVQQADALAGLASLALTQGNVPQALAYVEEVKPYLEKGYPAGAFEPLCIYLICYRVLTAAGDASALDILRTAHALLQECAAELDEAARRSFLENVPEHREIVAEWQKVAAARA